jgi:hypothetical protein
MDRPPKLRTGDFKRPPEVDFLWFVRQLGMLTSAALEELSRWPDAVKEAGKLREEMEALRRRITPCYQRLDRLLHRPRTAAPAEEPVRRYLHRRERLEMPHRPAGGGTTGSEEEET